MPASFLYEEGSKFLFRKTDKPRTSGNIYSIFTIIFMDISVELVAYKMDIAIINAYVLLRATVALRLCLIWQNSRMNPRKATINLFHDKASLSAYCGLFKRNKRGDIPSLIIKLQHQICRHRYRWRTLQDNHQRFP